MLDKIKQMFGKRKIREKSPDALVYTNSELIKTPVQGLVLGMYVAELDIPWLESPFMFQGFFIETEEQLQKLRDTCQYVYIDTTKVKRVYKATGSVEQRYSANELVIGAVPERLGSFATEIETSAANYSEAGDIVKNFMSKVASGGGVDVKKAKEVVEACVNNVLHSPDAILWLTQLKNKDEYTAQHSLNVCMLSIVLGRHIGLSLKDLNRVGLCGMMHDMGKMLVPLEILNKPGRLTDDEMEIMQSHTHLGYELLKSSQGMFKGAIETALTHHERQDGKGYPRGLPAHKLSYFSNIVAIADIYDAITSDRVYQTGRTHHEATKIMLDVSGSHLDHRLVVKFIESLGVYPPGSFVELNTGAIAVVVEEHQQFKLRPKILLILDEEKSPCEERLIDLSTDQSNTIRAIIEPKDYQIDVKKYYMKGVIQKGFH